ncbi:MAG: 2-amino-4-hydroxy-6-hydroxymethyldihydropteridine diphosphokinase [Chloroflexi bacterium]|nr:2-amino-4-hydroxy-6-hydroxymethyldihydropteridine diphosphokinase [Chloroflexota bacterium]
MNHTIYLGLGSNVGERRKFLGAALEALPPKVHFLRKSSLYETAPWGFEQQGDFLNVVVEAQTDLSPQELLDYLKDVESMVGREASFKNGPRQIDIDILFYDDLVLEEEGLVVPHPRVHARSFMLAPIVELTPELVHPVFGKTVSELLALAGTAGIKGKTPWNLNSETTNNK